MSSYMRLSLPWHGYMQLLSNKQKWELQADADLL